MIGESRGESHKRIWGQGIERQVSDRSSLWTVKLPRNIWAGTEVNITV